MLRSYGEYRRYERTGIRIPIAVNSPQEETSSRIADTTDISEGGLGLRRSSDLTIRPGSTLKLQIEGLGGRTITATVVHVGAEHIGLRLQREKLSTLDIENIISEAPRLEQIKVRMRRALWKTSRRAGVLAINTFLRPAVKGLVRPEFLFAVYGNEKDIGTYYTPAMAKVMPDTLIGGYIRNQNHRGMLVASHFLESELSQDSDKVTSYLNRLRADFPNVRKIALVGRLPNFAMKAGIPIEQPFVDGSMGTRYMIWDVARQMIEMTEYQRENVITVLGGAGRIGNLVCEDLLRVFSRVVAFDPRYDVDEEVRFEKGTVLRTSNRAALAKSKLFICLTHHGDVIKDLGDFMESGSLIADDTHPCISPEVREHLASKGVRTLKIILSHEEFRMWPRMPAWNNRDIPGCLVEALVMLDADAEAAGDFNRFMFVARKIGFRGRIIPPPED
jgi:hypothetical protein